MVNYDLLRRIILFVEVCLFTSYILIICILEVYFLKKYANVDLKECDSTRIKLSVACFIDFFCVIFGTASIIAFQIGLSQELTREFSFLVHALQAGLSLLSLDFFTTDNFGYDFCLDNVPEILTFLLIHFVVAYIIFGVFIIFILYMIYLCVVSSNCFNKCKYNRKSNKFFNEIDLVEMVTINSSDTSKTVESTEPVQITEINT